MTTTPLTLIVSFRLLAPAANGPVEGRHDELAWPLRRPGDNLWHPRARNESAVCPPRLKRWSRGVRVPAGPRPPTNPASIHLDTRLLLGQQQSLFMPDGPTSCYHDGVGVTGMPVRFKPCAVRNS